MVSLLPARKAIKSLHAEAKICTAYHQLIRIIIEYDREIIHADSSMYLVRDLAVSHMQRTYSQRPESDAQIVDVYVTNSESFEKVPTESGGRFVVLELAEITGYVSDHGNYMPPNTSGVCTYIEKGEMNATIRNDYRELTVLQLQPVAAADGSVILPGTLPQLKAADISMPDFDRIQKSKLPVKSGELWNVAWQLPTEAKTGMSYPLVVSIAGFGAQLFKGQKHAADYVNLTLTNAVCPWQNEDCIVFSPQVDISRLDLRTMREHLDEIADNIMGLVEDFLGKYPVDRNRVYLLGNSAGTVWCSTILKRREYAKTFTSYVQCNGHFEGAASMFKDEYTVPSSLRRLGLGSLDDYQNPELWLGGNDFFSTEQGKQYLSLFEAIVENRISVDIWHGLNDEQGATAKGVTTYLCLREAYRRKGLSEESLEKLVQIHLIPDRAFHEKGLFSYHSSTAYAVSLKEMRSDLLKNNKAELTTLR